MFRLIYSEFAISRIVKNINDRFNIPNSEAKRKTELVTYNYSIHQFVFWSMIPGISGCPICILSFDIDTYVAK